MKKTGRTRSGSQEGRKQLIVPSLATVLRAELHEFVVSAGMRVVEELLEEDRALICGPRYEHTATRKASRAGHAPGELVLGGRRVQVRRPRARTEGGEVTLPAWAHFSDEDPLERRAVEQMVIGVSTRKYRRSLEPIADDVKSRGTSRSAVSRRFVKRTKAALDGWLRGPLGEIDLVAVMIDGVYVEEHVILIALGIDSSGMKHVLGLREGATENAVSCTNLLADLRDRGMRTDRSMLFVLDGGKALRKAVRDVFGDRGLVQRCQAHKKRNVLEELPEDMRRSIGAALSEAYQTTDVARARRLLQQCASSLKSSHPSAAASLREGLDETLTVMGLCLPRALERTLATTNPIENMMGAVRRVSGRVKRWRGGEMILRWMGAALGEAQASFRRLKGHAAMPKLVAALRANDERLNLSIDAQEKAA
jgi:putative transposase